MPELTRRRRSAPVEDDYEEEEEEPVERPRDRVRRKAEEDVDFTDFDDDEEDDDDDDDGGEEDEDAEEDEDSDARPRRRPTSRPAKKAPAKRAAARRRPAPVEDDEDEDDEPAPRARRRPVEDEEEAPRPAARRSAATKAKQPPPGIRVGLNGAQETLKTGGGGVTRLQIGSEPELFKILENGPFVSFAQHWIRSEGRNQPYTCLGRDCPLCGLGDRANKVFAFNVLHLSASGAPEVKLLQIGVTPYQALTELAADKTTGKPNFTRNYWQVSKSGTRQRTQTNFMPVKVRDIPEDWPELLEHFDVEDLPALIEDAKTKLFDFSIIQTSTRKQLREVARYLTEDDEDDD